MSQNLTENSHEKMEAVTLQKDKVEDTENTVKESASDRHNEASNGKETLSERPSRKSKRTRSRSKTPQNKHDKGEKENNSVQISDTYGEKEEENKIENTTIHKVNISQNVGNTNEGDKNIREIKNTTADEVNITEEINITEEFILDSEAYMDPLVLQSDEPCAELEFEEGSDKDSGKYSPIISRCITRRSQNRNIPTPKTPKSVDEQESEKGTTPTSTPDPEEIPKSSLMSEFNETDNSSNTDNLSTKVQVGGDATRFDFSEGESYFLSSLKNKGSNSFPHCISSRRTIRPISEDVRKKTLKNSMQRANLSIPFFSSRDSVERAPSVKRKSRSETPEDRKKFKEDSPGFIAKMTSPLNTFRNKFASVPNSTSTPKLTSFRDDKNHLGGDFFDQMDMPNAALKPENQWCTIM